MKGGSQHIMPLLIIRKISIQKWPKASNRQCKNNYVSKKHTKKWTSQSTHTHALMFTCTNTCMHTPYTHIQKMKSAYPTLSKFIHKHLLQYGS